MLNPQLRRRLEAVLGRENFSTRAEDLVLYAYDGTNEEHRPEAVAWPGSTAEVSAVVSLSAEAGLPVVARGAGSGLTGGALPVAGGLVLAMSRFNRILSIDPANLTAEVEPGVVTADFQAAVEKVGLFYPPDPASREFSTLGGNAAENAGGTRAVKYGVTRDYVMGLEAVLGTGEIVKTGVRTPKGVVGYDLTRLLVGSEGTLAIITRLILRLLPKPESKKTVAALFDHLDAAARVVAAITAAGIVPTTLEFMDRAALDCVKTYAHLDLDPDDRALLLIETDGPEEQAEKEAEAVIRLCLEMKARSVKKAASQAEAETLWQARRAISPALFQAAPGKFNEDIVVPRSRIPDMVAETLAIGHRYGVAIINFGHLGDGNIHTNVMYDPAEPGRREAAEAAVEAIFKATLAMGGTLSGEHGIGTAKSAYIALELEPAVLSLMGRIKTAFDPKGILNPGKIFPPRPPDLTGAE